MIFNVMADTNDKTEFDYPINSTTSAEYTYSGSSGIKVNFLDRILYEM